MGTWLPWAFFRLRRINLLSYLSVSTCMLLLYVRCNIVLLVHIDFWFILVYLFMSDLLPKVGESVSFSQNVRKPFRHAWAPCWMITWMNRTQNGAVKVACGGFKCAVFSPKCESLSDVAKARYRDKVAIIGSWTICLKNGIQHGAGGWIPGHPLAANLCD